MIGNSNDETNFPHKLSLTDTQVSRLRNDCANNLSADIKSSKTKLSKIVQSGRFLGRHPGPSLKTRLPLMKNVFKPLAKYVLILLGLAAAASAAGAGIQEKVSGSGTTT